MVLDKLPVPGRPTNLDNSRARAYCACSRCGWGVVWSFFLSTVISHFYLPLSGRRPDIDCNPVKTRQNPLQYCPKGPSSPKQPTKSRWSQQEPYAHDLYRQQSNLTQLQFVGSSDCIFREATLRVQFLPLS